jgi:hypothetical protein
MSDQVKGTGFIQQMLHGDLVKDGTAAISIAEIVIRSNFGDVSLQEQQPLVVSDGGDCWIVDGSLNKDRLVEGPGKISLRLYKSDARISSLIFDYVMLPVASRPSSDR